MPSAYPFRDDEHDVCKHCGVRIVSDLTRGWIAPLHKRSTAAGMGGTWAFGAWCRSPTGRVAQSPRHEPIPLDDRVALQEWLDS